MDGHGPHHDSVPPPGVGAGITGQVLGMAQAHEVSAGTAVLAALVLTAPMSGCAEWSAVRSR